MKPSGSRVPAKCEHSNVIRCHTYFFFQKKGEISKMVDHKVCEKRSIRFARDANDEVDEEEEIFTRVVDMSPTPPKNEYRHCFKQSSQE